jgi:pSer/pThr/pTyr-binding forkhead associated (FHA) protein
MSDIMFGQVGQARELAVIPPPRVEPDAARLVVSRGPGTGTEFPITGSLVTIGRHRANDIALGDTTVSGQHAEIWVAGDHYQIADVGSFNGTYVNRRLVDRAELRDGDEVWIGRHRLLFRHQGTR